MVKIIAYLSDLAKYQTLLRKQTVINPVTQNFNVLYSEGSYQVNGASWSGSGAGPSLLNPMGTLTVSVSKDSITQVYTDRNGLVASRTTFGFATSGFSSSDSWTPWSYLNSTKTGYNVQSGNGITTDFQIAHGLSGVPSYATVMAQADDADNSNIRRIFVDATYITISYNVAPVTGSNNLSWYWLAKL